MSDQGEGKGGKPEGKPAPKNAPSIKELERRGDETESQARMEQPVDNRQSATSGIVARGHRVRFGSKGNFRYFGPGEVVQADAAEIARLRKLGVLVTPNAVVNENAGPRVLIEDEAARGAKEG